MSRGFEDDALTGGSYRRICDLASGGMGVVELAVREEGRFQRLYAVKRLRDLYREEDEFREMFLEEARIAGLLRHPNVVSVLDVGDDAGGPFLAMDYIEGASAAEVTTKVGQAGEEVPMQVALRIVMDTAEGLHAAHELCNARGRHMQLVHRDVSPQNLLVGYDGATRVTDFGIAKAWGRTTRTATGVLKGKFGYLSPEQLRFEEPDRRSDIFSLGIVLYELLSGERLYRNREGMDGARRILKEPPPDLGEIRDDVPPELVALSFSMLAKEPDHRPPDALTVARKLESILADLVTMEGRVEVADFMAEAFAEERRAQADRVRAAVASATGQVQHTDATVVSTTPIFDEPQRPASTGRVLPMIAVVGVIGVAAAVGAFLAVGWSADEDTAVESGDGAGPAVAPLAGAGSAPNAQAAEPENGTEDAPNVQDARDVPHAEEESAPPEAAARPAMTMRRARMSPMSSISSMSSMSGGVPMWDWQ